MLELQKMVPELYQVISLQAKESKILKAGSTASAAAAATQKRNAQRLQQVIPERSQEKPQRAKSKGTTRRNAKSFRRIWFSGRTRNVCRTCAADGRECTGMYRYGNTTDSKEMAEEGAGLPLQRGIL